jgi:hypothetical protein
MSDPQFSFDLSVNLGNVITIVGAVGAIVWKASSFESRLEKSDALRIEEEKNRTQEIAEIKQAINEMKSVVTIVAVQKERLDNQAAQVTEDRRAYNERVARLERMVDELRHNRGFIKDAI